MDQLVGFLLHLPLSEIGKKNRKNVEIVVVYITPNSLKMKNRKNKFASFSGRSV